MWGFDFKLFFAQFLYDEKNPLLFNNGFFIFFFTLFLCLYYSFRNHIRLRRYIFCFFSLYFFYKASGSFVLLVIISAIVDFILSNAIYKSKKPLIKKSLLIASICFNLGMLVYFKYTNFFISLSNELFNTGFNPLNILLPVGISFYTFENLSYTIDVYRGQLEPARKFSDYLLFLSFFPKLVMGPIVRAHDFVPQINKPYRITEKDFATGFYLIISGMFKKLIVSDYLTVNYVNYIFDDPGRYTGLENLVAVYAYAAVIYCDFSGYSDAALGFARWLAFSIPANFLSPYQSKNITEFWRRWHISLSSWLRDYLYIPLGGNKKASLGTWLFPSLFILACYYFFTHAFHFSVILSLACCCFLVLIFIIPALLGKGSVPTSFNLLTTMLLGGLWHGASINFILWGALHGIGLGLHKIWLMLFFQRSDSLKKNKYYSFISALFTFHFVCFCWVFFKAPNFGAATEMLHQISGNWDLSIWYAFYENYKGILYMVVLAFFLHLLPDSLADRLISRFNRIPLVVYVVLFLSFVALYGIFKSAEPVMPIYLQF